MPTPPEARAKLDRLGLDAICEAIMNGQSMRQLSMEQGISVASLSNWIAVDPERSVRVRAARMSSAATLEDLALDVLQDKTIDIQRGREIASHLRWAAKVRNPRDYGEKLELSGELALSGLSLEELNAKEAALLAQIATLTAAAPAAPTDTTEPDNPGS